MKGLQPIRIDQGSIDCDLIGAIGFGVGSRSRGAHNVLSGRGLNSRMFAQG
jgi:hypothetical protein